MKINLSQAGKRFNREWIFRNATMDFEQGISYAITGPNGTGKSTLLQCIAGMMQLSEGGIEYAIGNKQLVIDKVFAAISFCAPSLDLIEELTLTEFLNFHFRFKDLLPGMNTKNIIELLELETASQKQIRYFSSGMKQRVKLAQAIFSDTKVVLLDEPCSNLDAKGIELYHYLINTFCGDRLLIVSSNDEVEYSFATERINIVNYK